MPYDSTLGRYAGLAAAYRGFRMQHPRHASWRLGANGRPFTSVKGFAIDRARRSGLPLYRIDREGNAVREYIPQRGETR